MTAKELRAKSVDELKGELESLLKAHFYLRMRFAMQQLAKTSEIRQVKRSIARVKTILHEKAV